MTQWRRDHIRGQGLGRQCSTVQHSREQFKGMQGRVGVGESNECCRVGAGRKQAPTKTTLQCRGSRHGRSLYFELQTSVIRASPRKGRPLMDLPSGVWLDSPSSPSSPSSP